MAIKYVEYAMKENKLVTKRPSNSFLLHQILGAHQRYLAILWHKHALACFPWGTLPLPRVQTMESQL